MFAERSLTPFPDGANMHPSCPTCFSSLRLHVWVPRLLLSPPVLLTLSDCPVGFSQTQDSLRSRNPVG